MRIGAERLGWKTTEVPRWVKYSDIPGLDGIARGKRQSMTETLLPSAQDAGCRLLPNARVEKLERIRAHWRVKAVRQPEPLNVEAEAVFVCCGAIETPALLRRSGIKKNIGNTLALSPMIKVAAVFEDEVNNEYVDIGASQGILAAHQYRLLNLVPTLSRPRALRASGRRESIEATVAAHRFVEKARGEIYWIADRRPYSTNEIVDTVERLLEKEFKLTVAHKRVRLPDFASEAAALADVILQRFGLYNQKIHVLSEMNKTIACSITKAEKELGYEPKIALEEGMRRSLAWCIEQGIRI